MQEEIVIKRIMSNERRSTMVGHFSTYGDNKIYATVIFFFFFFFNSNPPDKSQNSNASYQSTKTDLRQKM